MTQAADPRSLTLNSLAVNLRGPSDAPVVVALVHGAMDRAASFTRVARRLTSAEPSGHDPSARNVLVVAHDRRGYAGSIPAGVAKSIREHAEDLAAVLDLADSRPVLVVGHSIGGTIALDAAAHTLSGCNLIGVGSYESPRPWDTTHRGPEGHSVGLESLQVARESGPEDAAEHFYRSMVGESVWGRLPETARALRRSEGPALVAEVSDVHSETFGVDCSSIGVPIHSAYGALSAPRMREAAVGLAREVGSEPTVFSRSGHGAHLSHPDTFSSWIRSMISEPEVG